VRVDYSMGCRSTSEWSEEEDRFLLCWAAEHGVDDNTGLQLAARTTPSMAFYHSMHTRTAVDFRRRTMALLRLMVKENAGFAKKKNARAARKEKMKRSREAEVAKWAATQKKWKQEDSAALDRERSLKSQLARDLNARLDMGHGQAPRTVPADVRSFAARSFAAVLARSSVHCFVRFNVSSCFEMRLVHSVPSRVLPPVRWRIFSLLTPPPLHRAPCQSPLSRRCRVSSRWSVVHFFFAFLLLVLLIIILSWALLSSSSLSLLSFLSINQSRSLRQGRTQRRRSLSSL